jgi:hypothetical protein
MNRSWRTATERKIRSAEAPDLIAVTWDGKVVPIEIRSPSQSVAKLTDKLARIMETAPPAQRSVVASRNVFEIGWNGSLPSWLQ